MIPLPQEYKVKGQRGFIYRQVQREGDVIISAQFDTDVDKGELEKLIGYEVFIVQRYEDRMSPDRKTFIAAREAVPSSERWGSLGFSFRADELDKAFLKFHELIRKVEEQKKQTEVKEYN